MKPFFFYGKRDNQYLNASQDKEKSDDSVLSDSDEDPDYIPQQPLTLQVQTVIMMKHHQHQQAELLVFQQKENC